MTVDTKRSRAIHPCGVKAMFKAGKGVRPMISMLGQEPGTINWLIAVYANCKKGNSRSR